MLNLSASDYTLAIEPGLGGSIARFDWRGEPLFRPTCGPSIIDTASFPLVPFSNRIAYGQFSDGWRDYRLRPNFPFPGNPHAIHGYGWLSEWQVDSAGSDHATLVHEHLTGDWPWAYRALQVFRLGQDGLRLEMSIENLSDGQMPVGLGFHPQLPRTDQTRLIGFHEGEWHTDADGVPTTLQLAGSAVDWWQGAPVASRIVDTAYCGREGALRVVWPERRLELRIEPSAELCVTVIYVPKGDDYFCAEPVSHAVNAINRDGGAEMRWLEPSEIWTVSAQLSAKVVDQERTST